MSGKRRRHPARILANVIKAIADLKDEEGSTVSTIAERLKCYIEENQPKKNCAFTTQVRKALRHGIQTGIIVHQGRRYKLGLSENKCQSIIDKTEEPSQNDEVKSETSISDLAEFLPGMGDGTDQIAGVMNESGRNRSIRRKHAVEPNRRNKKPRLNKEPTDEKNLNKGMWLIDHNVHF